MTKPYTQSVILISVSIHTSAREVTEIMCLCRSLHSVSIHTSAREVTVMEHNHQHFLLVSIHTSAREVTVGNFSFNSSIVCFNPHFRKGSDSNISQKTFPVFMKHYQIHLNLLPHIPSNILSMQKHTQICLFFLVRVVR